MLSSLLKAAADSTTDESSSNLPIVLGIAAAAGIAYYRENQRDSTLQSHARIVLSDSLLT